MRPLFARPRSEAFHSSLRFWCKIGQSAKGHRSIGKMVYIDARLAFVTLHSNRIRRALGRGCEAQDNCFAPTRPGAASVLQKARKIGSEVPGQQGGGRKCYWPKLRVTLRKRFVQMCAVDRTRTSVAHYRQLTAFEQFTQVSDRHLRALSGMTVGDLSRLSALRLRAAKADFNQRGRGRPIADLRPCLHLMEPRESKQMQPSTVRNTPEVGATNGA